MLADAWKTTPFVALLLLAGLQHIDRDALRGRRDRRRRPLAAVHRDHAAAAEPALLVAVLFRALDALRVFDVVYVMTGGGPGTATEPIALYTFVTRCRICASGRRGVVDDAVRHGVRLALAGIRLLGVTAFRDRIGMTAITRHGWR